MAVAVAMITGMMMVNIKDGVCDIAMRESVPTQDMFCYDTASWRGWN